MFKYLLSSIGLGNEWVNTTVDKNKFRIDESINGRVTLSSTALPISQIELILIERTVNTDETSEFSFIDHPVQRVVLTHFERETIAFSFDSPIKIESVSHQFFITTRVFLDNAVDLYDEDEIFFET